MINRNEIPEIKSTIFTLLFSHLFYVYPFFWFFDKKNTFSSVNYPFEINFR